VAHPTTKPAHTFTSKASPRKNVKPGRTITVKGTGAEKRTSFDCVMLIVDKKHTTAKYADVASLVTVRSTSKGKITCKEKFQPFSGTIAGKTRHCPTTSADKKAGMTCGIGMGDAKTLGDKSASLAVFTAKK
jgi:hypothetical protein